MIAVSRRFVPLAILFVVSHVVATAAPPEKESLDGPNEYKYFHPTELALIHSGKAAKAVARLEKYIAEHPKDTETLYTLAVGYAKLGETDKAIAATNRAIELGLPAARFLAGTRTGLESLRKHKRYVELREKDPVKLPYGPMLGCLTSDSVKVWVRTIGETDVKVEYMHSDEAGWQTSKTTHTSAAADYTAVVELTGLMPDTAYDYRVIVDPKGRTTSSQAIYHFHTVAAKGAAAKFRIAFGGGAGFVPKNERMWDTIAAQKPDALLLLGDNMYCDMPERPEIQQYCYYRQQARLEFARLVASVPVYSIWDDHDFGTDDCWGGPEIDEPAWKRPVWQVFRNNWVNPAYGGGEKQPGCWHDFYLGDVHFIMLDGRYYRTDPTSKDGVPSMLGPAQKEWLFDTLAKSTGTFNVLCSPVPWDYRTKGDSVDTWNGYKQERDEIFGYLEKNEVEGVLLMSADRHRSDLWKIERAKGYALYEFNSSRLTNQHVHETMKAAEFSYNKKQSFGTVDFDTKRDDPTATYSIWSIDGEKVFEFTVKLSQLEGGGPARESNSAAGQAKEKQQAGYDPTSGYEPHTIRNWQVLVNKRLDKQPDIKQAALREVESQLYRLERIVPDEILSSMRKTKIWLEQSARDRTAYHPDRKWLIRNGYNPDKTKGVEITHAQELVDLPGYRPEIVLLHEMVHAYHDQVLGFDHAEIIAAYDRAVMEKKYDDVLHIRGGRSRHYALENCKEFFAELSEAYLIANDYYPFVRPELKEYDPETHALLEKIWSATK